MCNCGHDMGNGDEADKLRKQAVMSAAGAACLAGVPALMANGAMHGHPLGVVLGIGLQLALIANALRLIVKRKRLLRSSAL